MLIHNKFMLACIFAIVASAQSQINLSGIVQNSRTKAPVVGATVRLQLALSNITDTTDADGKFAILGTSVLQPGITQNRAVPFVSPKTLLYRQIADGTTRIRILDLSGRESAVIFSGVLASGFWQVTPPDLSPGVYLCTFTTSQGESAVRFLAPAKFGSGTGALVRLSQRNDATPAGAIAKQAAAPLLPVDSLLVTKNGYRPAYAPLASYVQSNVTVLLEDTTATTTDDATIIPDASWPCYMPEGIPPPQRGEAVFSITLQYSAVHNVGLTKFGNRRQFDISGGTVTGSKITGTVLTGGLDYELTLSNGSVELEQINILRANNIPILMRNAGVAPAGGKYVRVVLDFEAPNSSSYTWLNTGKFVANRVVDSTAKTIKLDVYDVSKATAPETRVQIKDPADAVNQTWECFKLTGSNGTTVFTESVTLGASISIGASKRGSRNIIPITGGTTTGKVVGRILNGGADYQLGGLDARYTLAPNDGEFIIVRNCGSGGLVPVFEARVAGPYNYLNENKYLSSQPGMSGGGVSITFYEKK